MKKLIVVLVILTSLVVGPAANTRAQTIDLSVVCNAAICCYAWIDGVPIDSVTEDLNLVWLHHLNAWTSGGGLCTKQTVMHASATVKGGDNAFWDEIPEAQPNYAVSVTTLDRENVNQLKKAHADVESPPGQYPYRPTCFTGGVAAAGHGLNPTEPVPVASSINCYPGIV